MTVSNFILLIAEAVLYFSVLATLLHQRRKLGLGVLMTVLGVMHFLETYLAARFYILTPFGIVSPGSVMFYSGKLVMILLIYIREDATTVRQFIYGILGGNLLCLLFAAVLSLHTIAPMVGGLAPDNAFLNQMGVLMVWGTTLLYIESIGVILMYEAVGKALGRALLPRVWLATLTALAFDQIGFYAVLNLFYGAPASVFWAGLIGKTLLASIYALLAAGYFRLFSGTAPVTRFPADVFADLTYRERYAALLASSGTDALTGAWDRGRLEEAGPAILKEQLEKSQPLALIIADVDHFKSVNDHFGHLEGDAVLKDIADALKAGLRDSDMLFRFGGEEFLILLPGYAPMQAMHAAERLRAGVASKVKVRSGEAMSVSIGVAVAPMHGASLRELIDMADRGLYRAKADGRNRVAVLPQTG